ncbi:D-xylose 1-dehydrogenase Gfo6 [Halococcus saccharolyticus]|uniref:Glucose-fructose oxidoreductase n=1 Tax=Halococcus saccharolyticus DSM 5350 TaxID=1227455 RepID=M0MFW5_9EURY|nr:D-xylose 1-dehydrogenase Gfo6 [Halococcus saccharolyticus]EMA43320.1 glucose-fructose oxidoreductase [Halococcus saccharolyticus DSM 5350]
MANLDGYFAAFTQRDWQTIDEGSVRIAVIGLGGFARERALPAIRDAEFCETTVLVSGSPETAGNLAETFGVGQVLDYEAFHDGEESDAYDAVYVATPPAFHEEYATTAAERGKHVLCEKPLAADLAAAERIVDACADAGVVCMTAYRLRTEPAVRRMRELIADGAIGEPVQVHGGFSARLLDEMSPDTWRLDPHVAGGGALMDLGVYPLNTTRFLLDADPVSVVAETTSGEAPFDRVDEHVVFQLSFPGGVTASCTASFDAHPDSRLQILGTDGQVLITDPFGGDVSQEIVVERGDTHTRYAGPSVDEVREEFDYFAHCVLTGEDCETDGEDGLTDLRIIEAAYESAETGERIEL